MYNIWISGRHFGALKVAKRVVRPPFMVLESHKLSNIQPDFNHNRGQQLKESQWEEYTSQGL